MRIGKGLSVGLVLLALCIAFGGDATLGQAQQCTVTVQPGDSIQEAIELFGWGPDPVVCLAEGTWEENLRIERNLTLRGQGTEQSVIKGSQPGYPVVWIESESTTDVALSGLSVLDAQGMDGERDKCADNSGENWTCPYGVKIAGESNVTVRDVTVADNGRFGLAIAGFSNLTLSGSTMADNNLRGISAFGSASVTIADATVEGNGMGIVALESAAVEVDNTTIFKNGGYAVGVAGLSTMKLSESTISDNNYGVYAWDDSRLNLVRNRLTDNQWCGIGVFSEGVEVSGSLNTMHGNWVDLCGAVSSSLRTPLVPETDRVELRVPGDYQSLQEAIDAIAPGGTITLGNGTITEGATVWKPLTLQGAGIGQTTIEAPAVAISVLAEVQQSAIQDIHIQGAMAALYGQTTLNHVKVSKNGSGAPSIETGLGGHIKLQEVEVTGGSFTGVIAWTYAHIEIVNSLIAHNDHDGVNMNHSGILSVEGSQIRDNKTGIALYGSTTVSLRENRIVENVDWGIFAKQGTDQWGNAFVGEIHGCGNQVHDNGDSDISGLSSPTRRDLQEPCEASDLDETL